MAQTADAVKTAGRWGPSMVELRQSSFAGCWLVLLSGACSEPTAPDRCIGLEPTDIPAAVGASGSADAGASGSGAHVAAAGVAGAGHAAPESVSDEYAEDVSIEVHEHVATVLVVTWAQALAADQTWLEFSFEDQVMQSPPADGQPGAHREVVLGVPAETDVTVRVVSSKDGTRYVSSPYPSRTGALPISMPIPEVLAYDPRRASRERWLFGSVEDSEGGSYVDYYLSTFWLYIMDRKGRIVWYYADPATNATSSFQRIARDGQYIWIEKRPFSGSGERGVLKMTLDWEYFEEIPVPGLSDCIDVTDDGSLLYDADDELREMTRDGAVRTLWSCARHFGARFRCYSNTVNWDPESDTIMLSFPEENTVVEIDRHSGKLVGQYGSAAGSWDFAPPLTSPPEAWSFSFQHFPNLTPSGTLMVSTHLPGCGEYAAPTPHAHAFLEFEVDRDHRRLVEKWRYTEGPEWARAKGMAIRLPNGNTLGNYGTGGVIREITPDKRTVFHVKFDVPGGDDSYNKMVGNNVFIDDLYALNGGGPE
jgi:hypothetical protein